MAVWAPKRFWKSASVTEAEDGFGVALDGKPVKTPAKAPLRLPTRALAEAVAAEWEAQEGTIKPETMPCTRTANSALDKLSQQREEVIAMLAEYGGSDLLCYRAHHPAELVARQAAGWDPLLAWAETELSAPLKVVTGLMHEAQPGESLSALAAEIETLSNFELAAFHDLVTISGSLVMALAVIRRRIDAEEAFALSRIDESWQAEQWGIDEEAAEIEAKKRADFLQAWRFYELLRS